MAAFPEVLTKVRKSHKDFFDERSLTPPDDDELVIEVVDIKIPGPDEFSGQRIDNRPIDLPPAHDHDWDIEEDADDFEYDTRRSQEERHGFERGRTRVGVELLAVYRPFHFYPDGQWGVHFFERPMAQFASRFDRLFKGDGRPESSRQILKMVFYSVARHEFHHYLTELAALDLELKRGSSIYRPYWENVYKKSYPGPDCIEESLASVWSWLNPVTRSPVDVQSIFRRVIRSNPFPTYSRGADLLNSDVRDAEDILAAQLNKCVIKPTAPPPVWGTLPRPYHQPWTRYGNVTFSMNKSYGGTLGPVLNAGPLRKTIRIFHR